MIYRYARGHGGPQLILLGEHWRTIAGSKRGGGASKLSSRLRFADIYDAIASFHGVTSKQQMTKLRRAVRAVEKERTPRVRHIRLGTLSRPMALQLLRAVGTLRSQMRPVRAVFFDMGGTLIQAPGDPFHDAVMQRLRQAFDPCEWAEDLYRADLWKLASPEDPLRQETNRWISVWLRERGLHLTENDVERVRAAFAVPMPPEFELTPGAAEAVRWCRDRGLRTAVLTNVTSRGDTETRSDCERFALAFDHCISSYSTGWAKPHRAMFERALALTGLCPTDAVMVGDSYTADIVGAKRVGLRAIWVTPRAEPPSDFAERPDAAIASLTELPAILDQWMRG